MHRVAAICFEGIVPFDLVAPVHAFAGAAGRDGRPHYEVEVCSPGGAEVATYGGFAMRPTAGLAAAADGADTVLVPGSVGFLEPQPAEVVEALVAAAERGARLISVCTGAFTLAATGLLDGRRATTHWRWTEQLARRHPAVEVDPGVLYVDEGALLTSGGLSAGIDLALHVIRKDFGAAAGERVAREMVAPPYREGGQAQFFERQAVDAAEAGGTLEPTRRWALERLGEPLDVAAMASHAGVSPRTFARRFREETGTTPLQWLLARRVNEARRLLEETSLPIEEVAWRVGFGSAASLREHFRRATATTPTAYRRAFSPGPRVAVPA